MRKIQVQAHRGASGYAPENTLPAFQLAVDMNADGIECDIHYSKDGYFIVCHDETVDRTSNGTGVISEMTLDEIKALDFGKKFGEKFAGTTAPTLEEMLDVVKNMNVINIEIKEFGRDRDEEAILHKFYDILASYGIVDRVIVSSFHARLLKHLKDLHEDIYTCYLYGKQEKVAEYSKKLGCSAIHPYFGVGYLTTATVKSAHNRDMKVNAWTANTDEEIRRCVKLGCDGVITNYPDIAIAISEE
ncbi:MAG: glycerophosphodiester phosphodiesterase [Clostridia bacterium]|nr:glycerophosphodiester phosphodiesterase [Clostridia bacterium]